MSVKLPDELFERVRTGIQDADIYIGKLEAEIDRLRAALESCESWIDRWTRHVGPCEDADKCTCGRTAILHEARAALVPQTSDQQSIEMGHKK